jgi:hypothetical protein
MLRNGLLRASSRYLGQHRPLLRRYFDASYYFRLYRDEICRTKLDPLSHFTRHGLKENHAFSPLFWPDWYLQSNSDVAESGRSAALHYLRFGWKEGRRPNPLFDPSWYLACHADVKASGMEPLLHFITTGWQECRSPHPLFDVEWYLTLYPDVRKAGQNPLAHFIEQGWKQERQPHPLFDTAWYLKENPDVRAAGVNPLLHFLQTGGQEGRAPHSFFDSAWYQETNPAVAASGVNPLLHFVLDGLRQGSRPNRDFNLDAFLQARPGAAQMDSRALLRQLVAELPAPLTSRTVGADPELMASALMESRFFGLRSLTILNVHRSARKVNIITDSLEDGYLFAGVATSLVIATTLANASNRGLRIVTRNAHPNADNYSMLLRTYGLPKPASLELFSDVERLAASRYRLDVSPDDVFITTSWWSTYSLLKSGFLGRIFYLIQECETMFYPHGDEQLLARKTIGDPRLHFLVNSRLLYDHLAETEGHPRIREAGVFFEPAFPESCFTAPESAFAEKEKHRLFFYARPSNLRNLFHTGVAILDDAILHGLLDPDRVEVCFAGAPMERFEFSNGYRPTLLGKLPWTQYLEFLKTVDLGFSLIYTPHPSYPPLDVAATGGVALTNMFGNKTSLHSYSRNIVCFDLMSRAGATEGLGAALDLMRDGKRRKRQYQESGLSRDWNASLREVTRFFLETIDGRDADRAPS